MNNIHSNTTFLNEAIDKKTDVEDEKTDLILANMIDLRKTMSDVLSLLLGAKKNSVIDQALFRILQFFDVDRVYIGTFDEQTHTVDFTESKPINPDGLPCLKIGMTNKDETSCKIRRCCSLFASSGILETS